MIITDWIQTYVFLGYPPSNELEEEIFNKAKVLKFTERYLAFCELKILNIPVDPAFRNVSR